jgi:hypothetical protein
MKTSGQEQKDISHDVQMYIFCMEEIKKRIYIISQFLEKKATTSQPITDVEFLCLQFRKVLEFIALSSLSANREKYEEIRSNFKTDWHAERIMKKIEEINPNFYPCPIKQILDKEIEGRVIRIEAITDGFLTREDFSNVYNECSGFLHAYNPYSSKFQKLSVQRDNFKLWKEVIIKLLNHHQIQLIDDPRQLWVLMKSVDDGKVHVFEMIRI